MIKRIIAAGFVLEKREKILWESLLKIVTGRRRGRWSLNLLRPLSIMVIYFSGVLELEVFMWNTNRGKARELGPDTLTDEQLLSGIMCLNDEISQKVFDKFGSFKGMCDKTIEKFYAIKGIGKDKVMNLALAFELALRVVNAVKEDEGYKR